MAFYLKNYDLAHLSQVKIILLLMILYPSTLLAQICSHDGYNNYACKELILEACFYVEKILEKEHQFNPVKITPICNLKYKDKVHKEVVELYNQVLNNKEISIFEKMNLSCSLAIKLGQKVEIWDLFTKQYLHKVCLEKMEKQYEKLKFKESLKFKIIEIRNKIPLPSSILFLMFLVLIYFYFIPSIVAFNRNHKSKTKIFIINLLFGFTLIAWVLCLFWAIQSNRIQDP
jgi:hypothetical protein